MESVRSRYDAIFRRGTTTERIEFFSDAVFAIAMTLLVIDLKVPEEYHGETSWDVIVSLMPGFLAYVISFAVIAINWTTHHRKFRVFTGYDRRLIAINLVLLFLIAFVPFPTSLMSEYPAEVASVVLYASVVGLLNLVQMALWAYAWHNGLIKDTVDIGVYRYVLRNQLALPVVFGSSILVALFWDPAIAMYWWFLLIPVSIILPRIQRSNEVSRSRG